MNQRVEFLLESIKSQDSSLQAAMGNTHADTNNMRGHFELTAAHIIEVDPYRQSSRSNATKGNTLTLMYQVLVFQEEENLEFT